MTSFLLEIHEGVHIFILPLLAQLEIALVKLCEHQPEMSPFFRYDRRQFPYQPVFITVSLYQRNAAGSGFLFTPGMICEDLFQAYAGQVYPSRIGGQLEAQDILGICRLRTHTAKVKQMEANRGALPLYGEVGGKIRLELSEPAFYLWCMRQENFLEKKLQERRDQQAFRTLKLPSGKTDFCSNDYLGIIHYGLLETSEAHWLKHGSGGSRLLAGNDALTESTEQQLAGFHRADAALLYNSGYDANLGLLSAVPQRGDTIIYDQLSHASIRDGIRLSFAQSFSFRHNHLEDLEKRLQSATGNIFVVTESVFSMDGDQAPLTDMVTLCDRYNAQLIVDEAHATGVIGSMGEGLVQHLALEQRIFARVVTFGKAVGCHGAVVLGSQLLRDYLINFSRSFIYTTALPQASICAIRDAYALFPGMKKERGLLLSMIDMFQAGAAAISQTGFGHADPGGDDPRQRSSEIGGFDTAGCGYGCPSDPVSHGSQRGERLRIVLHAFNTEAQVKKLHKPVLQ